MAVTTRARAHAAGLLGDQNVEYVRRYCPTADDRRSRARARARGLARSPSDRDVHVVHKITILCPRIVGGLSTASIFPDMILGILLQHRLLDGRDSDYLRCNAARRNARERAREVPKDGRPVGRACTDVSKKSKDRLRDPAL